MAVMTAQCDRAFVVDPQKSGIYAVFKASEYHSHSLLIKKS